MDIATLLHGGPGVHTPTAGICVETIFRDDIVSSLWPRNSVNTSPLLQCDLWLECQDKDQKMWQFCLGKRQHWMPRVLQTNIKMQYKTMHRCTFCIRLPKVNYNLWRDDRIARTRTLALELPKVTILAFSFLLQLLLGNWKQSFLILFFPYN